MRVGANKKYKYWLTVGTGTVPGRKTVLRSELSAKLPKKGKQGRPEQGSKIMTSPNDDFLF